MLERQALGFHTRRIAVKAPQPPAAPVGRNDDVAILNDEAMPGDSLAKAATRVGGATTAMCSTGCGRPIKIGVALHRCGDAAGKHHSAGHSKGDTLVRCRG